MKLILSVFVSSLVSFGALAQNIAIVNGTVHTMAKQGRLENATLLIKDGIIEKVGTSIKVPAEYDVIDARGKVVTPGLMGVYTSLGLVEVDSWAGTVDSTTDSLPLSRVGAAYDSAYAINPDSSLITVNRIEGITSAASGFSYTGQLFKGQGSIITLGDRVQPIIKPHAFIATEVGNAGADHTGGSRAALWVALEQALNEVEYAQGKNLTPNTEWHGSLTKADISALQAVIEGKEPLLVDARRAADIRQVIALKQRHPSLKLVILRGIEAWRVADELAAANIPVILDPESNLPYQFDELGATLSNAGRLFAAGVMVAIGMETHNIRLATQNAGNAVANGLPWEQGLASLTINPARIYGVDKQIGSLETGKQADVVIWSGDPLEVTEVAEQVIIKGQLIPMTSRQTQLRDRYLKNSQNRDIPARYQQ